MRLNILLLSIVISFNINAHAQLNENYSQRKSAATVQYLTAEKALNSPPINSKFVYSEINKKRYLNAFIKVNESINIIELEGMGILIGTKAGDIWTVKIPLDRVEDFTKLEQGLEHVQLDQPVYINMDKAREKTNVDQVHQGIDLPQAFTGKGIIVGILDVGFDYTHPTFYDEQGDNYRIKRVWEQKTVGTPPSGYNYGHEIVNSEDIKLQQTDNPGESHGSHVAGIAAGSGLGGDGGEFKGVAYESDLVFVGITPARDQWANTGMTDIVDGLNYIYEYAASQGKPAVANLSWGCSIGPHDGTSLFSQAVDNLTGEGKIFAISAGNNGGNRIHLNKQFSNSDTLISSFIEFSTGLPEKKTWVDIWGETGESFCVQFDTYSGSNIISTTDLFCLNNKTTDTFILGSDSDTFFVNLTALEADINKKPHALVEIHSKTKDNILLSVKGSSGMINIWMGYVKETRGYYGEFVSRGKSGVSTGDDKMTIGEMACTESAIAVGAYASKVNFKNLSGQNLSYSNYVASNRICPFSSKGPTTDGRSKPDITAPGMTIASAFNSFDTRYTQGGANARYLVHEYIDTAANHNYYFGESSGTSMSSPMTTGIIALLLEANPLLTPGEILILLSNTAIKDKFTTDTPNPDIWGYGKIDAYAMMKSFFVSAVEETISQKNFLYPIPTIDDLNIGLEGYKTIIVTNLMGENCLRINTTDTKISLKDLNEGIYVVSVYDKEANLLISEKIVKL